MFWSPTWPALPHRLEAQLNMTQRTTDTEGKNMASLASRIKKDIEKTQPVEDGTIIKFEIMAEATSIRLSPGATITYGAIFLGGRWWLSGDKELMGARKFEHSRFMELLASESVVKAEVATDFEPVIAEKPRFEPIPFANPAFPTAPSISGSGPDGF